MSHHEQENSGRLGLKWLQASLGIHVFCAVIYILPQIVLLPKPKLHKIRPIEVQIATQPLIKSSVTPPAPSVPLSKKKSPKMAKKIALKAKETTMSTPKKVSNVAKKNAIKVSKEQAKASKAKLAMQEQEAKARQLAKQKAEKKRQAEAARQKKLALQAKQEKEKQQAIAKQKAQEAQRLALIAEKKQLQQDQLEIQQAREVLIGHMEQYLLQPKGVSEPWQATLEIMLDRLGKVQSVKLVSSSGSELYDRIAINTVYKAQPLPLPTNERIKEQFMHFRLNVSPK